jgi:lactoylglutathione lyase
MALLTPPILISSGRSCNILVNQLAMSEVALNLVVIRVPDLERSAAFYRLLGMTFTSHRHGAGPEHYACEMGGTVFEIYPRRDDTDSTAATRIGFRVRDLDNCLERLAKSGTTIVSPPKDSPWGRRGVVVDPDGHRVELTQ